ncbi:hypothetical protein BH23ACT8_BH23ACT8_25580 [soil metagenome]
MTQPHRSHRSDAEGAAEGTRPAPVSRGRLALPPARSVGLVAAGGAVGALARTALAARFPAAAEALPWVTLVENVTGAFALGWLLTVLVERLPTDRWVRPLVATGLLGAYTTFGAVALELDLLVAAGRSDIAAAYLAATWGAGLAAGGLGVALGRWRSRSTHGGHR